MTRPRVTRTHTVVELAVSAGAHAEIAGLLREALYDHVFMPDGMIDMTGIGLTVSAPIEYELLLAKKLILLESCAGDREQESNDARGHTPEAVDAFMADARLLREIAASLIAPSSASDREAPSGQVERALREIVELYHREGTTDRDILRDLSYAIPRAREALAARSLPDTGPIRALTDDELNAAQRRDAAVLRAAERLRAPSSVPAHAEPSGERWSFARKCAQAGVDFAAEIAPADGYELISARLDVLAHRLAKEPDRAAQVSGDSDETARGVIAQPKDAWHEDFGACLWWTAGAPGAGTTQGYVGGLLDHDFPDDVTHFTRIANPIFPPTPSPGSEPRGSGLAKDMTIW
jgi:hypothetical protein